MSSRLTRNRKEDGERRRREADDEAEKKRREDDYLEWMVKFGKKVFEEGRRRSASPRDRQAPPAREDPAAPPRTRGPPSPPAGRQLSRPPPPSQARPPHYQQAPGRGNSRAAASHLPRRQDFRGPSHQPSGRHDSRAAELNQRDLPANTPSGPTRRGLATSRWANRQAPPQEEASRGLARSGNNSALEAPPTNADNAPAANNAPPANSSGDVEMAQLPPGPDYLRVPLPASSSPAPGESPH